MSKAHATPARRPNGIYARKPHGYTGFKRVRKRIRRIPQPKTPSRCRAADRFRLGERWETSTIESYARWRDCTARSTPARQLRVVC